MNKIKLDNVLVSLFSGYSFRKKVENEPLGDMMVIQMKDLQNAYSSIGKNLTRVNSAPINDKYLLRKGDVLFIAKGSNNFALVYNLNIPKAIASSAFFVMRPDKTKIIPEYLAWYINQKPVQQYLKGNTSGTYVPNINKTTILGIQLQLPDKILQEKVVKIDFLRKQEYLLSNKLLSKRKQLITHKLIEIINT